MDLSDQEKLALAILKDPDADEQLWMAACEKLSEPDEKPAKRLLPSFTSSSLDYPISLCGSFGSGVLSVGLGSAAGICLSSIILATTTINSCVMNWGFASGLSALWCVMTFSLLFGFATGATRKFPSQHIGFRTGLLMPIFGALALANIFGLPMLLSMLGTWAYNVPLLCFMTVVTSYSLATHLVERNATIEEDDDEKRERKSPAQVAATHAFTSITISADQGLSPVWSYRENVVSSPCQGSSPNKIKLTPNAFLNIDPTTFISDDDGESS
jgi:hypothetical protein